MLASFDMGWVWGGRPFCQFVGVLCSHIDEGDENTPRVSESGQSQRERRAESLLHCRLSRDKAATTAISE